SVVIGRGSISRERLIEEMGSGLIVWDVQGAHSSNPVSGEISVVANPCLVVKNGDVLGAAKGVMIADNFYEMIRRVDEVADDVRRYSYLVSPSVRFSEVKIVTKLL
ncbi:MAG: hypothetical protein KIH01_00365, partial [Candidatus Freyarchaeota archaeon]|nr:hypothetical protein [Candidatus Jordarchaeia archaeon]